MRGKVVPNGNLDPGHSACRAGDPGLNNKNFFENNKVLSNTSVQLYLFEIFLGLTQLNTTLLQHVEIKR